MFTQALEEQDILRIRSVPKADLHNHGLLGFPVKEIETLSGRPVAGFQYNGNGIADLNGWIRREYLPLFRQPGALEAMVEAAFRQALRDGVTVLEMSIDAGISGFTGFSPGEVVTLLGSAWRKVAPAIDFRPELGFARPVSPRISMENLASYVEYGFFRSIDLYDDELSRPASEFRELYRFAKHHGLRCKAHAGEFGTAESVRETAEVLELDAIQHGIAASDSQEVMNWLARQQIPLNTCPTSNVMLQRVPSLREHPIRKLFDNGVRVTINTDDVLFFGQGVSEEFLNLYQAGVFSPEELDTIRISALG